MANGNGKLTKGRTMKRESKENYNLGFIIVKSYNILKKLEKGLKTTNEESTIK